MFKDAIAFTSSDEEVEGNTDEGEEDDEKNPGKGVAGAMFLAEEVADDEEAQEDGYEGDKVGEEDGF